MAKFNPKKLNLTERTQLLNLLWSIIAELKNKEEVKNFFKDLLSESEAIMLARRITVAQKLLEGDTYDIIMKKYGVGRSTVASVNRWLDSGLGGYEQALKRIKKLPKKDEQIPADFIKEIPNSFGWLRKKYPLYFLLLNLILDKRNKKTKKLK